MSAPVDSPAPAAAAVEPTTPPPAVQPGPWSADLDTYFGDNAEGKAAADRYMREVVQPRITTLETDSAPARDLYRDLLADPETTLAEVVAELYGEDRPDVVERFATVFAEGEPPAPAAPVAPGDDDVPAWAKPLLEREESARDKEAREAGAAEYAQTLAEMRTAHPDLTDADMELIHPFIASAGGDTEVAHTGYQAFITQFKAAHGITPVEAAAEITPPPVLGAQAAASAAPPIAKEYKTFDDAWEAWREERAGVAPPVVGSA